MESKKSLDELDLIATLLCDVQTSHCEVFTPRALRLTTERLRARYAREGIGLLTKTLPRLAKALDRALTGEVPLNSTGFRKIPGSQLPKFLGELFQCIFSLDGWVLPTPSVSCITDLRQILLCFYKYELPFGTDQEQEVLNQFERTDDELGFYNQVCSCNATCLSAPDRCPGQACLGCESAAGQARVPERRIVKRAKNLLQRLFLDFNERDIYPRHGPGSVSTKEIGAEKYFWSNVSERIRQSYPLDEYFFVSMSHVADHLQWLQAIGDSEDSAKVVLVPKDSRGPRLISEEPLAFQWIQQGLGRAIVEHVERHPLTRYNVHFRDQGPNQRGALLGSSDYGLYHHRRLDKFIKYPLKNGPYATLDLKEASDRVSIGLVQLLFPEPIQSSLLNCRSLSTMLPNGKIKTLNKFAPMGSALCFPVLALTVWAILTAAALDADAQSGIKSESHKSILVYGDDVIVETAQAENAMNILESFGLKVNRDKSCTKGFFRESCGVDAYRGSDVTPVRFRTLWSTSRRPNSYMSWIAYANQLYDRKYYAAYGYIAERIFAVYGEVPSRDMNLFACPSLADVPEEWRPKRQRSNKSHQKLEWKVWRLRTPRLVREINGWSMLLRYFCESVGRPKAQPTSVLAEADQSCDWCKSSPAHFSVSAYTMRDTGQLVKSWVGSGNPLKWRQPESICLNPMPSCNVGDDNVSSNPKG